MTTDGCSADFEVETDVLQDDTLDPYLFVIVVDYVLRAAIPDDGVWPQYSTVECAVSRSRNLDPNNAADIYSLWGLCKLAVQGPKCALDRPHHQHWSVWGPCRGR